MPEHRVWTTDRWKRAAYANGAPRDVLIRKAYIAEVKQVEDDPRGVQFAISSETVDRDGDSLAVSGWDLTNYRRNPVVLWAHDYRQLPVAKCVKIFTEDQKLKAIDTFPSRDVHPFADTVFQLVKGGYLNATSVGFLPLNAAPAVDPARANTRGVDFKSQELLEHSIVPVPSNPEALVEARSVLPRADWRAYRSELERLIDESDDVVPQLEAGWRASSSTRTVAVTGAKPSAADISAAIDDLLGPLIPDPVTAALSDPLILQSLVANISPAIDAAAKREVERLTGRLLE